MIELLANLLGISAYHAQCIFPLLVVGVLGAAAYIIVCGKDGL